MTPRMLERVRFTGGALDTTVRASVQKTASSAAGVDGETVVSGGRVVVVVHSTGDLEPVRKDPVNHSMELVEWQPGVTYRLVSARPSGKANRYLTVEAER